ncbi:MAG: ECF transporter S component [Actinomycetota bacterium]
MTRGAEPSRATSVAAAALTFATHALGVAAFMYPFFLGPVTAANRTMSHASEAPVLFSVFGVLLIAVAVTEARAGRMDAKQIALLGVLSGVNAVLRLPGALAGASLMFILPILCGYVFGPRFGFMLGASSMAASAVITGGVGPWLPFQMWALGWVGLGAGMVGKMLGRRVSRPWAVAVLAVYGWAAGLGFGALINVWFWPFQAGSTDISWTPGLGAAAAAGRYWRFYLLTSLAWDSARAVVNALLIVTLGRPVLRVLWRFRARLLVRWRPAAQERALA